MENNLEYLDSFTLIDEREKLKKYLNLMGINTQPCNREQFKNFILDSQIEIMIIEREINRVSRLLDNGN